MRDETLRTLEREFAAEPGAPSALRYAAELERVGERAKAVAVLLTARTDEGVRRALARSPAWTHPRGGAGACSFADVAPILRAPRVRWTAPAGTSDGGLIATALGVLATGGRTTVLDPDTGALVWSGDASPVGVLGDVLFARLERTVSAHDLGTGRELYRLEGPVNSRKDVFVGPGVLLCGGLEQDRRLGYAVDTLLAWPLSDPHEPPAPPRLVHRGTTTALIAEGKIIAEGREGTSVIDTRSWTRIETLRGSVRHADAHGLVLARAGETLEILDDACRARHQVALRRGEQCLALTPDLVVTSDASISRQTGRRVPLGFLGREESRTRHVAVVRGAAYAFFGAHSRTMIDGPILPDLPPELLAVDLEGRLLWRLVGPRAPGTRVVALAPLADRLYLLDRGPRGSTVTCLEGA